MGVLGVIIVAFGGSAALIGAVAWLIRSLTVHILSKDLENFKTKLQSAAYEHQVRFTKLHERRAEILADLYSKIVVLHNNATNFVRWYASVGDDQKVMNIQQLWQAAEEFNIYFERNRIYFDQATCEKIVSLKDVLSRACSVLAVFAHERDSISVSNEQVFDEWQKASRLLDKDVPKVMQMLEDSFRELMGVETHK
jgi:hypothetical protein